MGLFGRKKRIVSGSDSVRITGMRDHCRRKFVEGIKKRGVTKSVTEELDSYHQKKNPST